MGVRYEDEEVRVMKCRVCGAKLEKVITQLPFKVSEQTIVIVKDLPVLQCRNCQEYLLEDEVMARVEELLRKADNATELEIVRYAA